MNILQEIGADLIVRSEGDAGIIQLNRPKTINALTLEMTRGIAAALDEFENDPLVGLVLLEGAGERGLCAGGDIRSLYESARAGGDLGQVFWREEYILNARIAAYPKPYVAFMDGIVMGGGIGLSAHGSHRIVTEKTRIAMPEVGIGFFPDVGGTWLLTRAPGEVGTYAGLTGGNLDGADAVYAGLADKVVPSEAWPRLRDALTCAGTKVAPDDVWSIVHPFEIAVRQGPVTRQQPLIDRAFAHDRIEDIVAALTADPSEFAQATLKNLREKSPASLVLTLKLLRMARQSASLEECLQREYLAALQIFVSHDFVEGVRAAVIDKDRNPKWVPAKIEHVTPEFLATYFENRHSDAISFLKTSRLEQA